ncbi:MAG TPA: class I SAM-dependent methyltransferase [Chloroflexia bacterium]|nr:class I SAM-dependent methyltransferase [Chloroflexia bacterium]
MAEPTPLPDPAAAGPDPALLDRFAPFYDLEYGDYDADLDFFRNAAAQAAPGPGRPARVLELACGSGRVLLALARAGHHCTGVDIAPAMLALARERAARAGQRAGIQLVEARIEALPAGLGPFDLALCALNSFAYLPTQDAQIAMLTGVQPRLRPGGRLILDLSPVDADGPFPANGELIHQGTWARPDGGTVLKFVSGLWDPVAQQQHVHWVYDEVDAAGQIRRTIIPQTIRYTYRWEAQLLLERAGFHLAALYGSYECDPYTAGAARLIVVGQRDG